MRGRRWCPATLAVLTMAACLGATTGSLAKQGDTSPARAPRWFGYRTTYFQFDAETLKRFGEAGVEVVNFHPFNVLSALGVPYSPYPPVWIGPGVYDFDSLDRHFADILAANPRAKFVCKIDRLSSGGRSKCMH